MSSCVGHENEVPLRASAVLATTYDVALLDLDGVVYTGGMAVPGAPQALARAAHQGLRVAYVTNNASRPAAAVAEHLRSLGVQASTDDVVTSAQAAARLLSEIVPPRTKVLVVGGAGLHEALLAMGLIPVTSLADQPGAVVQGFDPSVGWLDLAEGSYAVAQGLPWVASNTDLTIPTDRGIAPGNGTLVAAIASATGRRPLVAGKPHLPMHREAIRRTGARRPLIVGDRLDTDIEGAVRGGADSLLVLTGVTGIPELLAAGPQHRPTFLGADLDQLLTSHPTTSSTPDGWVCGRWQVGVEGELAASRRADADQSASSEPGPDWLDALRAACATSWSCESAQRGALIDRLATRLGELRGAAS